MTPRVRFPQARRGRESTQGGPQVATRQHEIGDRSSVPLYSEPSASSSSEWSTCHRIHKGATEWRSPFAVRCAPNEDTWNGGRLLRALLVGAVGDVRTLGRPHVCPAPPELACSRRLGFARLGRDRRRRSHVCANTATAIPTSCLTASGAGGPGPAERDGAAPGTYGTSARNAQSATRRRGDRWLQFSLLSSLRG